MADCTNECRIYCFMGKSRSVRCGCQCHNAPKVDEITPELRASLNKLHRPISVPRETSFASDLRCEFDRGDWPCVTRRLLDEVAEREAQLAEAVRQKEIADQALADQAQARWVANAQALAAAESQLAAVRALRDRLSRRALQLRSRSKSKKAITWLGASVYEEVVDKLDAILTAPTVDRLTPQERALVEQSRPVNPDGSFHKGFRALPWWFAIIDKLAPCPREGSTAPLPPPRRG